MNVHFLSNKSSSTIFSNSHLDNQKKGGAHVANYIMTFNTQVSLATDLSVDREGLSTSCVPYYRIYNAL